jgi:hypothetical protein
MGPDLHLIKQVEQVTRLVLGGPARRFAEIPSVGSQTRRRILIWQLLNWLLFGCKNSQEMAEDDLRSTRPGMLPPPPGGFMNRATRAAEPLPCQIR